MRIDLLDFASPLSMYMNFHYDFHCTQTTVSVENTCINGFIGTSAATPLASGIIALVLEAKYVMQISVHVTSFILTFD